MGNTYNFYNLEASFKEYLLAGNNKPVSIKNYLSDLRHFIGWMTFHIQSNHESEKIVKASNKDLISKFLTRENIQEYKNYLEENKIPHKTINRRLSTIRKLCSFCIAQGWMEKNLGKQVVNIQPRSVNKTNAFLDQFEKDLRQKGFDNNVVTSSLNTIQDLLHTV